MFHWTGKFIEHLRSFEFSDPSGKGQLEIYIASLLEVKKQILNTLKLLRRTLKENLPAGQAGHLNEPLLKLCKIPGIGFTTAVTLYTELMDIKRFSSFDKLVSFVGLSPSKRSSAETEKILGISFHYNKYLRSMLVESAWIAVRIDPSLTNLYGQYIRRMSKQEAIIRIAKKLLSRIRYVWLNNKDYQNRICNSQRKIVLKKIKIN
jgi:transposase